MEYVVAIEYRWDITYRVRLFDTDTLTSQIVKGEEMIREMQHGKKYGNIKLKYEDCYPWRIYNDFKSFGCMVGKMPIMNKDGKVWKNEKSVTIVGFEGEFVHCVNGDGKYCKVHMLQVANNVKNGKIELTNAKVREDGWILPGAF